MSWFHRDGGGKFHPILKSADYTAILGAECADGRLVRLCYTGHAGITAAGVVQAIALPPGDAAPELLWRAQLANERDLEDGHVFVGDEVVVTRVAEKSGHTVIGHALWTGKELWRVPCAKMVSSLGAERGGAVVVFVTFDHAVHAIEVATGKHELREPVPTDQARDRVMAHTRPPRRDYAVESSARAPDEWSDQREVAPGLTVFERDWAGTREVGIGTAAGAAHAHLLGRGTYHGSLRVGPVIVLAFRVELDGEARRHHWYLYSADHPELLAILREDGRSERFEHGRSVWTGTL